MSIQIRNNYLSIQLAFFSTFTLFLVILYFVAIVFEVYSFINIAGTLALFVSSILMSYIIVKKYPLMFWSPLPWFLLASGVYFGLGPLVYYYGTEETIRFVNSLWVVTPLDITKTNVLNAASIMVIIAMVSILGIFFGYIPKKIPKEPCMRDYHFSIWLFLSIGLTVKYFFALPYTLGLTNFVLPGIILHMDKFILAAIVILVALIQKGHKKYRLLLYIVLISELITAVMTFSKMAVLLVFFSVMFGVYLANRSLKKVIMLGLLAIVFYVFVLSPFVTYSRIYFRAGGAVDLNQLFNASESYANKRNDLSEVLPGVQSWWSRLCYTNAQVFVMNQYQQNISGNSFDSILWIFVPRLIYPDKPVFSDAKELTKMIQGVEVNNNITAGIFAEAYWNGGILCLFFMCVYIGALFFFLGRFAVGVVIDKRYQYMPLLMMGIGLGYSIDSWFVPTFAGTIIEWIFFYYIITFLFSKKEKNRSFKGIA